MEQFGMFLAHLGSFLAHFGRYELSKKRMPR